MPKLFKDGLFVQDDWADTAILSLDQWLEASGTDLATVELQADQPPTPLLAQLDKLQLVCVRFGSFMDGRGFSYARELRDSGYTGELRAVGGFIPDQLLYLRRCGFDCFEVPESAELADIQSLLDGIDEHYQASADQPTPLSDRRTR